MTSHSSVSYGTSHAWTDTQQQLCRYLPIPMLHMQPDEAAQSHGWVTSSSFCHDITSLHLLHLGVNRSCIYTATKWDLHATLNNYTLLSCQVRHVTARECICMCTPVTFPRQTDNLPIPNDSPVIHPRILLVKTAEKGKAVKQHSRTSQC